MKRQLGQDGGAATASRARARAIDLAPVIASLWASGITSLQAIADELNARQIPTARGAFASTISGDTASTTPPASDARNRDGIVSRYFASSECS